MKLRKPDETEQSQNLKSARNTFMFYTIALFTWAAYDLITTGDYGWQMTILLAGGVVFWWSRVFLYKTEEKEKAPSKAMLWTIFYLVIFLAIIFIANYFS
ncbi:hypothetical protein [Paraliobacillus zengyii]|uniref:hypothetical protein n=1 Tax=Paraliobacillus zengyii TaxID=2213194 RepID=UPI001F53FBED|nr:hypothetical protein [Paraliobacillus zengyii]